MTRTTVSALPAAVRLLLDAINQAPSADNTQPWRFRFDGRSVGIAFDEEKSDGHIFDAKSRASQLTLGAMYENAKMVAKDAGFVLGGPAPSTLLNSELSLVVDAPHNRAGASRALAERATKEPRVRTPHQPRALSA
jgi:hypothetical protein